MNRAGGYKTTEFSDLERVHRRRTRCRSAGWRWRSSTSPKHKGTATVRGYIKDRAGNLQPVWKVRAGDRVVITDSVDEEVHVVTETDYGHDDKTARLAIDDSFQRLDAYLDRYANALSARGL